MSCKLSSPCPYNRQCKDCLHRNPTGKKNRKTGIPTEDMRAYKREYNREYNRRRNQERLEFEMRCAGVMKD